MLHPGVTLEHYWVWMQNKTKIKEKMIGAHEKVQPSLIMKEIKVKITMRYISHQ